MISKQTNLFREENEIRSALFSEDRRYRYWLLRKWHKDLPLIMFIGLNPSTADETQNDPTIRRVIKFAKNWGYGGVYMCNLFAYVSTDPKKLVTSGEDLSENDIALQVCKSKCKDVLFAWGAFKEAKERADRGIRMFPEALCLKLNQNGSPIHPLYVPGNLTPRKYLVS